MRVIGGEFRRRLLKSVPGLDTRPTPDRLRETLFNILAPRIQGAVFADLYAGTGAVGIEALSRGARRAIFVESNRDAVNVIRENLKSLGLGNRAEVRQGRASTVEADIVFVDPPYELARAYESALTQIHAPLLIFQHDRRLQFPNATRLVKQGDNCLSFFEAPDPGTRLGSY
jgi:16S rRNA (guanine(966)-N(2))-methyltransferase RsmD